jgi:AcrR family transcriptional regulator
MRRPKKTAAPEVAPSLPGATVDDFVDAALRAAQELGKDIADVPVPDIARHAGVSRSTLLRRFGGSRAALDDAVRARGIDPGGTPVRTRALDAAALLIAESGLGAATLEAIAARAECSVPSMYAIFGTRDGLLRAVFERHSPLLDIEDFLADDHSDLRATVHRLYELMVNSLSRQPRVAPAMFAELFARPTSPVAQSLVTYTAPRVFAVVGQWLTTEVQAGRIRDAPLPLLIQQLLAPVAVHMLLRPGESNVPGIDMPDIAVVCDFFTDTFLRAVGTAPPR